ncbi:tetratricopeptide repeat protein [Streptomyces sp. NPDC090025]|uniref:tetratricopeptide repeat protein n=1 Tax=Streptomyces sp. NPDC090025 TaxID=3365922 RepID=UPI003833BC1E
MSTEERDPARPTEPSAERSTTLSAADSAERSAALSTAVALRTAGHREEAKDRLLALAARFPDDAEVAYQTAWAHDVLGLEADAVPHYERALAAGTPSALSAEDRRGTLLGLGSTYRTLGRYADAVATLRRGTEEFPDDGALRAFLAMALYNTGDHHDSVRLLLQLLAETSTDPSVRKYRAAVEYYAQDLDKVE